MQRVSDREIVQYYGQIWANVKHMKSFIRELRERYIKEMGEEKWKLIKYIQNGQATLK